jgi:hypothetical protein
METEGQGRRSGRQDDDRAKHDSGIGPHAGCRREGTTLPLPPGGEGPPSRPTSQPAAPDPAARAWQGALIAIVSALAVIGLILWALWG